MARTLGVISLLVALAMQAAEPRPAALLTRSGILTLTLPADLLRNSEVKEQLTSGLTTVFVIAASARDRSGSHGGGARIEVRYQLWEEKYLVAVIEATGVERKLTFDSEAALATWWKSDPIAAFAPRSYEGPIEVKVTLRMLPFSAQEQNDTRRWLSRTLSASGAGHDDAAERAAGVLRIIVQTSIQRRPLLERTWSVSAVRVAP